MLTSRLSDLKDSSIKNLDEFKRLSKTCDMTDAVLVCVSNAKKFDKDIFDDVIKYVCLENDIDVEDSYGNTHLHEITKYPLRSKHVLRALLNNGADPNHRNIMKETPLHCCDRSHVKLLLEYGADVQARDLNLNTPVFRKYDDLLVYDPNAVNGMGKTLLSVSSERVQIHLIKMGANCLDKDFLSLMLDEPMMINAVVENTDLGELVEFIEKHSLLGENRRLNYFCKLKIWEDYHKPVKSAVV